MSDITIKESIVIPQIVLDKYRISSMRLNNPADNQTPSGYVKLIPFNSNSKESDETRYKEIELSQQSITSLLDLLSTIVQQELG